MIKIEIIDKGKFREVTGLVDDKPVICLTNEVNGVWGVIYAASLPWNIDKAGEIIKCFNEAHDRTGI